MKSKIKIVAAMAMLGKRANDSEDLDLVKVIIILKESFRSVGSLFVKSVNCVLTRDSQTTTLAVYGSCRFIQLAARAKAQGEQLFRFVLSQDRSDLSIDHEKSLIAFQKAKKLNHEASIVVWNFLDVGLTPDFIKSCLEIWNDFYTKDPLFLSAKTEMPKAKVSLER